MTSDPLISPEYIRNFSIIAHIDHGKSTLADRFIQVCGGLSEREMKEQVLDSMPLERERGITIKAQSVTLYYKAQDGHRYQLNFIDTPGHADFGSEVERVLRMVDSVLLVVDAYEGPMPQTRFVLKKSLELGLHPIVVINKIDKPASDPKRVHDEVFELFMELGANDAQLDFTTVYAIGREGVAMRNLTDERVNLEPLLDTILEKVQKASGDITKPFQAQVFNLAYDNFLGRLAVCRLYDGKITLNATVYAKKSDGTIATGKVTKIYTFAGTNRTEVTEAGAGDIAIIAGIPDVYIGDTLCTSQDTETLPAITIDEPTLQMNFSVNNSPFAGTEGKFVTSRQLRKRLYTELEKNEELMD